MRLAIAILAMIAFPAFHQAALAIGPTGTSPDWGALDRLTSDDRAIARQALSKMERDEPAKLPKLANVSFFPLSGGSDLLLVRAYSFGNCGDFNVTILGPRAADHRRTTLLPDICLSDLRFRPHPGSDMPDLAIEISDLTDSIWLWNGTEWKYDGPVESIKPPKNRIDLSRGPLAHLKHLAGTYDVVAALQDPAVDPILRKGLGESYVKLLNNLSTRSPWDYLSNCLMVRGLAPHQGGVEEAMLAICMNGKVYAAILTEARQMTLFSTDSSYDSIPLPIREFLGRNDKISTPPADNFTWLH